MHAPRRLSARKLAFGAGSFLLVLAAVYAVTGKRNSFLLYESGSGEHYGDLLPEEVAVIPSLDLANLPLKVVQLFLDPCFYSLCSLHEYAGIRAAWRQPLSIQLPALLLIPLCVVAVGLLVVRASRRREAGAAAPRELQLLTEMTIAASGLTLGYLASSWASSSALRFGFARDFMLAALLAGIVGVCVLTAWLYGAVLRRGEVRVPGTQRRLSPARACVVAAGVGTLVLMTAVVVAAQLRAAAAGRTPPRVARVQGDVRGGDLPDRDRRQESRRRERHDSVDVAADVRLRLGRAELHAARAGSGAGRLDAVLVRRSEARRRVADGHGRAAEQRGPAGRRRLERLRRVSPPTRTWRTKRGRP